MSTSWTSTATRSTGGRSAEVGLTPLAHRLGSQGFRDLVDVRHLEDTRRHQHDLAAADQVAIGEAEIDGATGNARLALEPLAEPRAAHELGAERHRGMR